MIVVPMNPNAVYIAMVPNGCLKAAFDTTYPIQLNNIIRQDEFQESIGTINRTFSSRKWTLIIGLICLVGILGGFGVLIGGLLSLRSNTKLLFPVFLGVGIGLIFFGMIFLSVGCCIVQARKTKRMRQAIAAESAKYTMRSPVPCSWRLDVTTSYNGGYGNRRRAVVIYHLIIDIGRSVGPSDGSTPYQYNQGNLYPSPYAAQQNYFPPPPSYSGQSAAAFCSRCGIARQNPTMKFCSSCGQGFP